MHSAIVWIDSKTAKVFEVSGEHVQGHAVHREETEHHVHPHTPRAGHHEERFFREVAGHLTDKDALIVLGPGVVKDQFVHHLRDHHPNLARAVRMVEPSDHPTDAQLVAYARAHFKPPHATI